MWTAYCWRAFKTLAFCFVYQLNNCSIIYDLHMPLITTFPFFIHYCKKKNHRVLVYHAPQEMSIPIWFPSLLIMAAPTNHVKYPWTINTLWFLQFFVKSCYFHCCAMLRHITGCYFLFAALFFCPICIDFAFLFCMWPPPWWYYPVFIS